MDFCKENNRLSPEAGCIYYYVFIMKSIAPALESLWHSAHCHPKYFEIKPFYDDVTKEKRKVQLCLSQNSNAGGNLLVNKPLNTFTNQNTVTVTTRSI